MGQSLYTLDTLASTGGAAGVVLVVSNTVQRAFNYNPKWFALVLAELVALLGTYGATGTAHVPTDAAVAVLNGCLIYCTAVGGSSLAGSTRARRPRGGSVGPDLGSTDRSFFSAWY